MREQRDETLARLAAWGTNVRSDATAPPATLIARVRRRSRAWIVPLVLSASGLGLAAVLALAVFRSPPTPPGSGPEQLAGPISSAPVKEIPAAMIRELERLPEPTASLPGTLIRVGNIRSPEVADAWFRRGS